MKKVFEKKIIIGSVFGMVATIIGVIAVFFPSLLNLEKEKITNTLTMNINTMEDAEKFAGFVFDQIADDPKIFRLDVIFCVTDNQKGIEFKDYEDGAFVSILNYDEDGYIIDGSEIMVSGSFTKSWKRFVDTDRCELGGTVLEGYFLSLGSGGTHQGITSTDIRGIPLEQIKLKDY